MLGVQQLAVGTTQQVRGQRLTQCVVLQQDGKPRQGALFHRRTCQAFQRRPDRRFFIGTKGRPFLPYPPFQPFRRPGAALLPVDTGQRLKGYLAFRTQVIVLATKTQNRRAQRTPHVESENP